MGQPIEVGERWTVYSEILGEERELLIRLPEAYVWSSFSYPVLYLLDADAHPAHPARVPIAGQATWRRGRCHG